MAGPLLKRASAIVWLPPRGEGRVLPGADARLPAFTRGADGAWTYAPASLEALAARKTVVLLVDARDVTLLSPVLPPLPGARLVRALPNLVEDLLLQDAAACVLALGPATGAPGARLVAACDRQWLEQVVASVERRGLAVAGIWPAALALPVAAGGWTLACAHDGLALRRGELDAIGWPAGAEAGQRAEAIVALLRAAGMEASPADAPDTSDAPVAPDAPAAQTEVRRAALPALRVLIEDESWREPVGRALAPLGVGPVAIEPLAAPVAAPVDLLAPLRGRQRVGTLARARWLQWRWPASLAAACLLAALVGLNAHWARLAGEQTALRAALERGFRQVMPASTAMVDPLLQLRRHVTSLRARGGAAGADDFVPLLTSFSRALGAGADDAVASLDYRDGVLRIKLRPGRADSDAAREALREACARAGLSVRFDTGADPAVIVQVQS